jgi:hypothetical protein
MFQKNTLLPSSWSKARQETNRVPLADDGSLLGLLLDLEDGNDMSFPNVGLSPNCTGNINTAQRHMNLAYVLCSKRTRENGLGGL